MACRVRGRWTALLVLTLLAVGCGDPSTAPTTVPATSLPIATATLAPSTTAFVASPTTTTSIALPVNPTTTTVASPPELVVEGKGPVYTLEEAQVFGEFGPLLWGLVTTLNGTDAIAHGPRHEWVIWGPLWAGRLPVQGLYDVYGVTDLSAVDPEAIAAVVPAGTTIVLREVRWSLDELNQFEALIRSGVPDNGICEIGGGSLVNRLRLVSTVPDPDLAGVPPEAVVVEVVGECPEGYFLPGEESPP
ncbi:MAG: hypothetical protein ABIJ48_11310 [Actinomycetota bacterium]